MPKDPSRIEFSLKELPNIELSDEKLWALFNEYLKRHNENKNENKNAPDPLSGKHNFPRVLKRAIRTHWKELESPKKRFVPILISKWELYNLNMNRFNLPMFPIICCELINSTLVEINLSNAELMNTAFQKCDMSGANLSKADLSEAYFKDTNLEGANLSNANLTRTKFVNCNIRGADLHQATIKKTLFDKCDMRDVDLRGSSIDNLFIRNTDLRNADIRWCRINSSYNREVQLILKDNFVVQDDQNNTILRTHPDMEFLVSDRDKTWFKLLSSVKWTLRYEQDEDSYITDPYYHRRRDGRWTW